MPMESKAAVLDRPVAEGNFDDEQPVSVETIEVKEPTGEEVLVEIEATSVCHTDVGFALGDFDTSYPIVMGHEGAGIVRDTGDRVESLSVGDSVVLGRIACRKCSRCREGNSHLCEKRVPSQRAGTLRTGDIAFSRDEEQLHHCLGVSSFTEYTVVTEEVAIKIPEQIPKEKATLLGCGVFTGFGAVENTADIELDSSVVVFGAGGVGLNAVQAANICDAGDIVVVDMVTEKLELAEKLGATHTVDATNADVTNEVKTILDGGADYSFEITGSTAVAGQSVEVLTSTGTAVLVGIPPYGQQSVDLNLYDMVFGEKELRGSLSGSYNLSLAIPRLAKLVDEGRLSLDELITDKRPLSEINQALSDLEEGGQIRQVLRP